ncbi:13548_t:CDS:10 [Ambispora leptoticha]|uniref:ubiquitinyl hydrolase 1 n=1 Tax=Ambispora leptoticha TaxID=144679 RepID=A0A9N8W2J7_9GLOM|nr:13548_t:CDS:10 [Ambispora leptoticha]
MHKCTNNYFRTIVSEQTTFYGRTSKTISRKAKAMLQRAAYTKSELDGFAETLDKHTSPEAKTWLSYLINPHKSMFGLGNYDVNVLELALKKIGLEIQWFDFRKDIRTVIQFTDPTLFGLILNIPSIRFYFWRSNHWIAIKPFFQEGKQQEDIAKVYNLDSKLSSPYEFENSEEVYKFLEGVVYHKERLSREQTQLSNDEDDNGIIRCICGYSDDDGFTIQCDKCKIWQHGACVNVDRNKVPEEYLCEECHPRAMNVHRAKKHQKSLREELGSDWREPEMADSDGHDHDMKDASDHSSQHEKDSFVESKQSRNVHGFSPLVKERGGGSSPSRSDTISSQKKQKNGKLIKPIRDSSSKETNNKSDDELDESADSGRDFQESNPEYKKVEKNVIASKEVDELFRKILTQYQRQAQHRKRSLSMSSSSSPMKNDDGNSNEIIETPNKKKKSGIDTWQTVNSEVNSKDVTIHKSSTQQSPFNLFPMERESLLRPLMKTIVKKINSSSSRQKGQICYGLFAETNVTSGFLFEFKGQVCLKSAYKSDGTNQYSLLGVTKPFVLFHPTLDLCVDARVYGNEARFIRRSCRPNAEARSIFVPGGEDQQVHLVVFAKCEILKGDEITVGWDWEPNHVDLSLIENAEGCSTQNEITINSRRKKMGETANAILELTDCACENTITCVIYRMQREGRIKTTKQNKKNTRSTDDSAKLKKVGKKEMKRREISSRRANSEDHNMDQPAAKRGEKDLPNKRPRHEDTISHDMNGSQSNKERKLKNKIEQKNVKKKISENARRSRADSTSSNKGKIKVGKNSLSTPYSRKQEKSNDSELLNSPPLTSVDRRKKNPRSKVTKGSNKKTIEEAEDEEGAYLSSPVSSLSSITDVGSSEDQEDNQNALNGKLNKPQKSIRVSSSNNQSLSSESSKKGSAATVTSSTASFGDDKRSDASKESSEKISQTVQSPMISYLPHLPLKKYWAQRYLAQKAANTPKDTNGAVGTINNQSEVAKRAESSKQDIDNIKNNKIEDQKEEVNNKMDADNHGEREVIVPRATPIVPAKRVAVDDEYKTKPIVSSVDHLDSDSINKRQKIETEPPPSYNEEGDASTEIEESKETPKDRIEAKQENELVTSIKNPESDSSSSLLVRRLNSKNLKEEFSKPSLKVANAISETQEFNKNSRPSTPNQQIEQNRTQSSLSLALQTSGNNSSLAVNQNSNKSNISGDPNQSSSDITEKRTQSISQPSFSSEQQPSMETIPHTSNPETPTVAPSTPTKLKKYTFEEYKEKKKMEESLRTSDGDNITKRTQDSTDQSSSPLLKSSSTNHSGSNSGKEITTENPKDKLDDFNISSSISSFKSPRLSTNHITKSSISPASDDYFPEDLPIDESLSLDTNNNFSTKEYSSQYEEIRERRSPTYKEFSSNKQSSEFSLSSINPHPFNDPPIPTSPRSGYTSPPRAPRHNYNGPFRSRMTQPNGPFNRNLQMSPGDRGRYYSSNYFGSSGVSPISSLPSTPRQGAPPSLLSSSASSPYDPANPDGHLSNAQNERDQSVIDNSNRGSPGIGSVDYKREYPRPGGDRFDSRERGWNNQSYFRERDRRDWERDRDDSRKEWIKREHYRENRERDYNIAGGGNGGGSNPEMSRYPMDLRRSNGGGHQDRYNMSGTSLRSPIPYSARRDESSNTTPPGRIDMTEINSGSSPLPTGPAAGNDSSTSNNSSMQRFGMEEHRRNRR